MKDNVKAAVEFANTWIGIAEPITREYINLDEAAKRMQSTRLKAMDNYHETVNSRTYGEALKHIEKTRDELIGILDGLRANFICDVYFHGPMNADDPIWDALEADNKAVEEAVTSVDAAIAQTIEMMNKEYEETRYG